MLNRYKENFDLAKYKKAVGVKSNIHKVSYYFKDDVEELHSKRILVFDLEFSMNKHIFEVGGLILNNSKVEETFFKEFSLPIGEPYWCFDSNAFTIAPLNIDKDLFSNQDKDWLLELIDSVDYVVVHNYVAEAQCIEKLNNNNYSALTCELLQNKKFICTNYSFKNKYFKQQGITNTTNSAISEFFGWSIENQDYKYVVKNNDIKFSVDRPKGVESILHNSFYDSVVTLTNFISLKKIGS